MHNSTPITVIWSKSQAEEEFHYGGRLFFRTGSSYISAVNWYMSMKFGLWIDFELRKSVATLNKKTGSSTAPPRQTSWNCILHHYSAANGPILAKFTNLIHDSTQITTIWSKSQREEEFQYGGRLFSQNGSSYIWAVDQDTSTKFGLRIDFERWMKVTSLHTKPEAVLRHLCPLPLSWNCISPPHVARFVRNLVAWLSTPITVMWSK